MAALIQRDKNLDSLMQDKGAKKEISLCRINNFIH
jgi:hypothetical protein